MGILLNDLIKLIRKIGVSKGRKFTLIQRIIDKKLNYQMINRVK